LTQIRSRWLRYLPAVLRNRIEHRRNLQAIFSNIGWLFADKVIRMGVGLFVGVWIARYLGPEQFGLWSFTTAFVGLFGVFATLGLDSIVVRELVKNPERQNAILGSAFVLKLIGALITLLLVTLAISFLRNGETLAFWLVAISAAGYIFQSINVIDFYFQAILKSKYTVYATNGAFLIVTFIKIILLLTEAPLIAFAWVGFVEIVLTSFFLLLAYQANNHNVRKWYFNGQVALELLKTSWPLILSGIAIMIYMRIDQIMIGEIIGDKAVGLFSAAVRISEVWYFIPIAIVNSVFPAIVKSKELSEDIYYSRLQKLFNFMAWLGIAVAVFTSFCAGFVVNLLFGAEYVDATNVLVIHIWTGIFVALGVSSLGWFNIENLQKIFLYKTVVGGVVNVGLNLILIPRFGINGAAFATVISQLLASVIFNGFFRKTRRIFFMQLNFIFLYRFLIKKA